jgi:hypothetical protein
LAAALISSHVATSSSCRAVRRVRRPSAAIPRAI